MMKKTIYVMALGATVLMAACNKQNSEPGQSGISKTKSTAMRAGASHEFVDEKSPCKNESGSCSGEVIITNKKKCEELNSAIAGGPNLVQDFFNDPQLDPAFKAYWDPADLLGLQNGNLFMATVHNPATNLHFYFVGSTPQVSQQNFDFVYQFVY